MRDDGTNTAENLKDSGSSAIVNMKLKELKKRLDNIEDDEKEVYIHIIDDNDDWYYELFDKVPIYEEGDIVYIEGGVYN